MKTNYLILILIFLGCHSITAQESKHFMFKGVPIDGQVSEFVLNLKNKGFIHLFGSNGFTQMRGDFAGYNNCLVKIPTLYPNDVAYKVLVFFPELDNWQELFENYFEIKEMLIEKYGEPTESSEKFEMTGLNALDYRSSLYKIKTDRCSYKTLWNTEFGNIHLSITHKDGKSCLVRLVYLDKVNAENRKIKILGDL